MNDEVTVSNEADEVWILDGSRVIYTPEMETVSV